MSLLTQPLWQADSLGSPLPDDDFGVSVSLPLWQHVIGYEEGDQAVVSQFRSGYPRFFLPPAIAKLFENVEREVAAAGERCLVFPRRVHAERCVAWLEKHKTTGRVVEFGEEALGVALFKADDYATARNASGASREAISARQALHALGECSAITLEQGQAADTDAARNAWLSSWAGAVEDVFLFPSGMAATFAGAPHDHRFVP